MQLKHLNWVNPCGPMAQSAITMANTAGSLQDGSTSYLISTHSHVNWWLFTVGSYNVKKKEQKSENSDQRAH